jgi:hypothetical protein
LGPRALAEFLEDIADYFDLTEGVLALLGDYGRLSPGMLAATGAEKFPPRPLHLVPHDLGDGGVS